MATTRVKLPIHHHPLSPYVGFFILEMCKGCNEKLARTYGGYRCNEPLCYAWFHKECAEALSVINHIYHPQHPLLLTNASGDGSCDLCGQELLISCYSCPTCEFKLDLLCGIKPSPPSIEHPLCHDHPLVFLKKREGKEVPCELCKDSIGGPSYSCLECHVYFHVDCVQLSKEISHHPCHSNHPLKLFTTESLTDDAEKICLSCGEEQPKYVVYHCSICNFTTCIKCTKTPPPLVVEHTKTHMHPLTLFSTRISFTCRICGGKDIEKLLYNMPYICLQCNFVIHGVCIDLPRVININRHHHRISFTPHLGAEYSKCGVCRKYISQYYGAYSCSVCPNYAVHFLCAMKNYIWDYKELEGIPDDAEDNIASFKVVGDNLISHISHEEHPLRLLCKEDTINNEHKRCKACCDPVGLGSFYVCEECCFFLHEKCANLPMKTKFAFSIYPYTLKVVCRINYCNFCGILSDGFQYTAQGKMDIDVQCASLSEPFVHKGHIHPLYFSKINNYYCRGCYNNGIRSQHMLHCDDCDFNLCFYCASLPDKIWYMNDEHPLTLCCVEEGSNKNWCDNCERRLVPRKWFYTCSDCGVTLHVHCVLGDFSRLMPGRIFEIVHGRQYEVVLNNQNNRPSCIFCHSRCKASVILKFRNEDNGYLCSYPCYLNT